jgi:16S rRNA (adenine1518-N6/adenine1519-N6)-dimethyltransferase
MSDRKVDLSRPGTARAVARRAGVVAKGRFSQNFLIDGDVVEAIVDELDPGGDDSVFEIGPGLGTLTDRLAGRAGRVIAVDIDPACVRACAITLRHHDNVEIIEGDARDLDLGSLLPAKWLAAGNLPYHLTGALLTAVLEREVPPQRAVFMIQREVAQRLAAGSGGWSLATVAIRTLADVEVVRTVPPTAFDPAPKVHSAIIRVTPRDDRMPEVDRRQVLALAKVTFQMRRKTLRHGLASWLGGDLPLASQILRECEIDEMRRPGTLDLDEWQRLTRVAIGLRSTHGNQTQPG